MARLKPVDRQALLLYVSAAIALGFVDYRVRPGNLQTYPVTQYIPGVLAGTYGAPADYRVLAPYLIDLFTRTTGVDPLVGFVITRILFIYASLVALHAYVREWYAPGAAVGAVMGVVALLPLTFTNGWANPDSFPELALFTLGCLFVARRQDGAFLLTLVVATLNRETAGFLVLLWACYRVRLTHARELLRLTIYALTWLGIYVGVRWLRGFQSYQLLMLWENLDSLKPVPPGYDPYRRMFGYFWLLLLSVPAGLAIRGSRIPGTPAFMKCALPVAGVFITTCFLISKTIEARIFIPAVPLLLPALMRAFTDPERGHGED